MPIVLQKIRISCCLAVVIFMSLALCPSRSNAIGRPDQNPNDQVILIDGSGTGPVFDGIGAVSAGASSRLLVDYPEPERSQILDYLFKPDYGAALQHLKVEIGADVDSTDGSEPSFMRSPSNMDFHRGYEWWLMEEAHKRDPKIVLDSLAWGAPGWIGKGRFYSQDMIKYVIAFLQGAQRIYHLHIAYTGGWNERPFDIAYIENLSKALKAHGLTTKVVCCDIPAHRNGWSMVGPLHSNAAFANAVSVVSVHYPWGYDDATTPQGARDLGKPLWSSEDQPNSGGGPYISRDWNAGGRLLAKLYNMNYLQGGFTATEIWSPVTSYYGILAAPGSGLMIANTPWSGHYTVQGAIWATAHTTQFTEPGWTFDNPSCGYLAKGGSFVTYLSPNRKYWSTVIESIDAHQAQTVRIRFTGGLHPRAVHVWETNDTRTFDHVADLTPSHGVVAIKVDPDSLYTLTNTTGQGRGTAKPPPSAPFPLPYMDDFESTPIGHAARYLSDQDGAFEVHPCRKRTGKCLEQVITVKPIPWGPLPDPFTLAGDEAWKDYSVSAEVEIPNTGIGSLFGRIDSADVFRNGRALYPSGYGIVMKSSGAWHLISTEYKGPTRILAQGEVPPTADSWHHLELEFRGSNIDAIIDGRTVASVADSTHTHGMFSLGSNWTKVQFDDLQVSP